jgi:hypothetical protein
VEGSTDVPV